MGICDAEEEGDQAEKGGVKRKGGQSDRVLSQKRQRKTESPKTGFKAANGVNSGKSDERIAAVLSNDDKEEESSGSENEARKTSCDPGLEWIFGPKDEFEQTGNSEKSPSCQKVVPKVTQLFTSTY